ncbi:MAG: YopX family protein [Bacteroidota bacterium]
MNNFYRAWHPDESKMYYFNSFAEINNFQFSHGEFDEYRNEHGGCVTFMQSIRAKDKEIFEGDLLKYFGRVGQVEYCQEMTAYCIRINNDRILLKSKVLRDAILIGNIYENDRQKITDWVKEHPNISNRLKNGLLNKSNIKNPPVYMDEIGTYSDFIRIRGLALNAWTEFSEITGFE